MSSSADIVLAGVLAVAVGALVVTTVWLRSALIDRTTTIGDLDAEKLKSGELADARDVALVKASQLQTQNDELVRRLAAADATRTAAAAKEASDAASAIASAPTAADALALLNRGLAVSGELHTSASVPAAGAPAPSASADHHDGDGAAVPSRPAPGDGVSRG